MPRTAHPFAEGSLNLPLPKHLSKLMQCSESFEDNAMLVRLTVHQCIRRVSVLYHLLLVPVSRRKFCPVASIAGSSTTIDVVASQHNVQGYPALQNPVLCRHSLYPPCWATCLITGTKYLPPCLFTEAVGLQVKKRFFSLFKRKIRVLTKQLLQDFCRRRLSVLHPCVCTASGMEQQSAPLGKRMNLRRRLSCMRVSVTMRATGRCLPAPAQTGAATTSRS